MKSLVLIQTPLILAAFWLGLTAYSVSVPTQQADEKSKPVITGHPLIDRMDEITHVPGRFMHIEVSEIDSIGRSCGDSLFWEIVKLGQEAIPYLITKTQDSSTTNIRIPCTDTTLTVGAIAVMALDYILPIPWAMVFDAQWCTFERYCEFGYPYGLIPFIAKSPKKVHQDITKWYNQYQRKVKRIQLTPASQCDCQKHFGVSYRLTIEYDE